VTASKSHLIDKDEIGKEEILRLQGEALPDVFLGLPGM